MVEATDERDPGVCFKGTKKRHGQEMGIQTHGYSRSELELGKTYHL